MAEPQPTLLDAPDAAGFVYVLINPAMPDMVKIGLTTKTPEERARRLRTTGVPSPFVVVWDEVVSNAREVESACHLALAPWRVDGRREFFAVPPKQAIRTLMDQSQQRRLHVAVQRSRNFLPEVKERSKLDIPPGIAEAWIAYERGGMHLCSAIAGGMAVHSTRLNQYVLDGDPVFSVLDPADVAVDLLLSMPDDVLDRIIERSVLPPRGGRGSREAGSGAASVEP